MHKNDRFRALAADIQQSPTEVGAAERHFRAIATRLEQSFDASRFVRIGSHARGTAIRDFSDVDILAVLPRNAARRGSRLVKPKTFLSHVAQDLQDRYTSTGVRKDGQSVVLHFSGGTQRVDVVPGIFLQMNERRPMYLIPGNLDEWIPTSPESHDIVFRKANVRSGGKLGNLARLIKAWKFARETKIPIASFYTDMLLSHTDLAAGVKSYGQCLYDFFNVLVKREIRGLRDPAGVAGIVTASAHQGHIDRLLNAAQFAREHAYSALRAEDAGRLIEASRQWSLVFNRVV